MKYLILVCAAAIILLIVYLVIENFFMLTMRHVKAGSSFRIAHISDIHRKKYIGGIKVIADRIIRESPDLIFITGDLVSRSETDFTDTEALLKSLCKAAPVYLIFGNHEQSLPEDKQQEFLEMLSRTEAVILRNETAEITVNGEKLNICGIEPPYTTYKKNGGYRELDGFTSDDMKRLVGGCPAGRTLLLAHNPLFGREYAEWGADNTFSGHVHGGSVRLFGVGLLSPERRFFPEYSKGEYTIGNMKLFVSAGIGKPRAFDPPEIVIYDL